MTIAAQQPVAEALRHCRDITRRRARNFYYGLKLTPEPRRSALFAVYAWMRRADDLVDGTADDPQRRREAIDAFREATDAALAGRIVEQDPIWIALADTASRFEVDRQSLHDLIDGQLDDLGGHSYETFEDVRRYCYRVASTVGLICIDIWGYEDPAARELAADRGIAFQLTNILRDYKEDFDAGRVYLPAEDFRHHGLTPRALRGWEDPARCDRLILEQVARARAYYHRSAALDGMITPSCRPTLWAMTTIYRGLLEKVERVPARIVSDRRLRLSFWRKASIALIARRKGARNETLGHSMAGAR